MLIIFDGQQLEWRKGELADITIRGYQMSVSGVMSSGVVVASGWIGSGNYGEWQVSGYEAYTLEVVDADVIMTSPLISVPTRVTWTLTTEEL